MGSHYKPCFICEKENSKAGLGSLSLRWYWGMGSGVLGLQELAIDGDHDRGDSRVDGDGLGDGDQGRKLGREAVEH